MSFSSSTLFESIVVGRSELQARIAFSPCTRLRSIDHIPGEEAIEYYRQRASTPGTLLITEATLIAGQAGGYTNGPGIWSDAQIAAWKKVTDAIHEKGSFAYMQLLALGRQAPAAILSAEGYEVVGPSAIAMKDGDMPRALTIPEIKEYAVLHAQAAKNAIAAGFDGVEIHAANGYLLDEFLHENSNHRTDEYGGSIENRARFTLEVVDAVVEVIGADRTGIRLSPWGLYGDVDPGISPIPQWSYVVAELESRARDGKRMAFIDLMEVRLDLQFEGVNNLSRSSNRFVRDIWQGVILRSGSFGHNVNEMFEEVEKDDKLIFALGRFFMSNPDLIEKVRDGTPLDPYDRSTFYWDGEYDITKGYTRDFVKTQA